MTSDENKQLSTKKAKTVRMLVTSFGLGRGKTPSGRSLVTPKLRVPQTQESEKRPSLEKMLSQNNRTSPLKLTQGTEAGMLKAPSPFKMVSPRKLAAFNAFDGLYKDVAYHVDPIKKEISFTWDFSNHKGYYTLPPAAMMKLNTIDYGEQIVTKQDAVRHAKTAIDIIHRGVENIFYAPNRNLPGHYTGGALTEGDIEKEYGKQPSPTKMVSPKKLSPSMISKNFRKLETLRTPERGVGEDRLPVLAKREVRTNTQNPQIHRNAVEKVTYLDIPAMISPGKKLSPKLLTQQATPLITQKAASPAKMVSPALAPRMPARVSPSKVSPSKFGGVTATGKKATVIPNAKILMSHYDSETASSKVPWEEKVIHALNMDDTDYAYELYYDEYTVLNPGADGRHHIQTMERAVETLKRRLAVDNMRIAREAFEKFDFDKALEYFTRSWYNNGGKDDETAIHREFQKKLRLNNNKIQQQSTKLKQVSPGFANPSLKSADKAQLTVKRDEVVSVLNDLVRNMTIVLTGPASIQILSGNPAITKKACVDAIVDSFNLSRREDYRRLKQAVTGTVVFDNITIKFMLDRSHKTKVKGTYRGYKYLIDQAAGKYYYNSTGAVENGYSDEFEPMTYSNEELEERVKHDIDVAIGTKPSPKGAQKMPSPKVKVQKPSLPVKPSVPVKVSPAKVSPGKISPAQKEAPKYYSKGHIMFVGEYELFLVGERVMKAPIDGELDQYGYKLDKKLVATKSEFEKRRQFFISKFKSGADVKSTEKMTATEKKTSPEKRVSPKKQPALDGEKAVIVEALNDQIKALSEEINKAARQGIKSNEKVAEMNRLIMQRDAKLGVKRNFAPPARKPQRR